MENGGGIMDKRMSELEKFMVKNYVQDQDKLITLTKETPEYKSLAEEYDESDLEMFLKRTAFYSSPEGQFRKYARTFYQYRLEAACILSSSTEIRKKEIRNYYERFQLLLARKGVDFKIKDERQKELFVEELMKEDARERKRSGIDAIKE